MVARGHVQNGVVVLDHGVRLPEGQEVTVAPVVPTPASGQKYYVSPEKRKAILSLIGILKSDQPPPTDEEVEKIIEEARMRKYG
jgi:hypothetical protein